MSSSVRLWIETLIRNKTSWCQSRHVLEYPIFIKILFNKKLKKTTGDLWIKLTFSSHTYSCKLHRQNNTQNILNANFLKFLDVPVSESSLLPLWRTVHGITFYKLKEKI